jgi:hypothetical protein
MVPVEQFARRGTQASSGVLFCDMVRALHEMAGLPSVDLGNGTMLLLTQSLAFRCRHFRFCLQLLFCPSLCCNR